MHSSSAQPAKVAFPCINLNERCPLQMKHLGYGFGVDAWAVRGVKLPWASMGESTSQHEAKTQGPDVLYHFGLGVYILPSN